MSQYACPECQKSGKTVMIEKRMSRAGKEYTSNTDGSPHSASVGPNQWIHTENRFQFDYVKEHGHLPTPEPMKTAGTLNDQQKAVYEKSIKELNEFYRPMEQAARDFLISIGDKEPNPSHVGLLIKVLIRDL